MVSDKKRMILGHKKAIETLEDIENRRKIQEQDKQERHHRMYDKVRLEKLNVANRSNYLNDQTFKKG